MNLDLIKANIDAANLKNLNCNLYSGDNYDLAFNSLTMTSLDAVVVGFYETDNLEISSTSFKFKCMGGILPDTIDKAKKVNVKWTADTLLEVANADDSNWESS